MLEISGKLECKHQVDPDYNNPFEIDIIHTSLENMYLMYILFLLVRTMTVSILHFKFQIDNLDLKHDHVPRRPADDSDGACLHGPARPEILPSSVRVDN